MALISNNISGSASNNSKVGITGSVIIANASEFPPGVGNNLTLYVSGNVATKPAFEPDYLSKGTSIFAGDVVISGTLFGDSIVNSNGDITVQANSFYPSGGNLKLRASSQGGPSPKIEIVSEGNTTDAIEISSSLGFVKISGASINLKNSTVIGNQPGVNSVNDLGSDVFFYVSGVVDSSGTSTRGTALFGGDVYSSGALETERYLRLLPTTLPQQPVDSSSYIFTSGSTNDLYFAQYNYPYENKTRLRWLEGGLVTGLLHGGVLSTEAGTTTFSITSGSGLLTAFNASLGIEPFPTTRIIDWPSYSSQSLTYSGSAQLTYVGINSSGGLIQQITPFAGEDYQNYIFIGKVLHQSGSVTNGAITYPLVAYGMNQWNNYFNRAIGPLKISGHVLYGSGSTLGILKTAGDSYVMGRNYTYNPSSPDLVTSVSDTQVTVSKIYREYVSGSTSFIDTGISNAGYTSIDPILRNVGGTLQSVSNNKFTIQRVYWFPNSVNKAFYVYYGNDEFDTLNEAQAGITTEVFTEGSNTLDAAILVAYILVKKEATNLINSNSRIIQAGVFRGTGIGGGGANGGGTTVPGGIDTYIQFNDGGSTFGGDSGLTYNKTTDTLSTVNIDATKGTFEQLTGSLTKLHDGSDYLRAGTNITLTTGSGGEITIASDLLTNSYDIGANVTGRPAPSEVLMRVIVGHSASITSGYSYCASAAVSSLSLTIQKGIQSGGSISYSSVGTIDYLATNIVGTVNISGGSFSLNPGNIIKVTAPSIQDGTFESPSFTFVGIQLA